MDVSSSWTVKQLHAYCKANGIHGYSALPKAELIKFILGHSSSSTVTTHPTESSKSVGISETPSVPFSSWTVKQLHAYCKANGIHGYSALPKAELIKFILGHSSSSTVTTHPTESSKSVGISETPSVPFSSWTVKQLHAYCKANGIHGYSALPKAELIELIRWHCDEIAFAVTGDFSAGAVSDEDDETGDSGYETTSTGSGCDDLCDERVDTKLPLSHILEGHPVGYRKHGKGDVVYYEVAIKSEYLGRIRSDVENMKQIILSLTSGKSFWVGKSSGPGNLKSRFKDDKYSGFRYRAAVGSFRTENVALDVEKILIIWAKALKRSLNKKTGKDGNQHCEKPHHVYIVW
eukprot:TRINITY_DN280_c0_g1_i1.p1 TRINITY_DN280_c0_g1~~TRINITY_DN280_c0_g1_i1.p1  ORF type:complete len:378 (-),score=77.76 TRINITY_DN280_c0_g1_i1:387-1430(-)